MLIKSSLAIPAIGVAQTSTASVPMSRSILSSEEIAALVEGFGDGTGAMPRIPAASAVPGGPVQRALKDLDLIHESFAGGLGSALSDLTKREVVVIAQAARASNCQDWTGELHKPRLAYAMRIQGVASRGLIVFEGSWLRGLLELMLGGTGKTDPVERRTEFSPVERVIASRMAVLACDVYGRAYAASATRGVKCCHCKGQADIHAYAMPDAALICGQFQMVADAINGRAWIVFPMELLGPIVNRSNAARSRSAGAATSVNPRI